jgi:hypothetical protein
VVFRLDIPENVVVVNNGRGFVHGCKAEFVLVRDLQRVEIACII